jgi:hypothetical protein
MSGKASATRESCARARGRHSSAAASGGPCSRLLYGGASRFHDMSRSVPTLPGDDRLPLLGVNGAATAMGLIGPPKRAKCAIVQKSITPATRGNARERLVFQHNGVRPRFCVVPVSPKCLRSMKSFKHPCSVPLVGGSDGLVFGKCWLDKC